MPLHAWRRAGRDDDPSWLRGSAQEAADGGRAMSDGIISELAATIKARRMAAGDKSYTRQLLDAGAERCARKFGEEAVEAIVASLGSDKQALASEAADVIYHLLVLLEASGLSWAEVATVLQKRTSQSGLAEKASRHTSAS